MKRFLSKFVLFGAIAVAGCASYSDGSTQRVEFITPGVIGVDCRAENEQYKFEIYTPDVVTLERSYKPLTLTCKKPGYKTSITEIPVITNNNTFWNLGNGLIPGVLYDAGSRSLAAYPDRVVVEMTKLVDEPETVVKSFEAEPVPAPVLTVEPHQEGYRYYTPATPIPTEADIEADRSLGSKDKR